MSRLIFEARRRLAPPTTRKGTITIEAPPELPRVIPPSFLRRAMPYVLVILIVGMVVALVATGMRVISPQTLFFPFVLLLAATALYRGNDNKTRTAEIVGIREKLDCRSASHRVLGRQLSFAKFFAVEIGDHTRAVEIEFDHLEVVTNIVGDSLLGEIDEMGVPAIGTTRLLPYYRKVLAGRASALKVVRKLKKAVKKPILAVKSVPGHDRRCLRRANGQRKATTRHHQGAP